VLRVVEDLTESETAVLMGCRVGTVKSNLARGLATLRERITETEEVLR
jgi:DNA-directed RNA polymerase specialized sigma24 family protein